MRTPAVASPLHFLCRPVRDLPTAQFAVWFARVEEPVLPQNQERPGALRGQRDTPQGSQRARISDATLGVRAIVHLAGPAFSLAFAALVWLTILYHGIVLPFMSDVEATFGLLRIVTVVSSAIAIFNLIPIPPLDGGRLALVGIEALRGKPLVNEKQCV